jgi:hypothetical protein
MCAALEGSEGELSRAERDEGSFSTRSSCFSSSCCCGGDSKILSVCVDTGLFFFLWSFNVVYFFLWLLRYAVEAERFL